MNINQTGTMKAKERKVVNAYAHPYESFVQALLRNPQFNRHHNLCDNLLYVYVLRSKGCE